MLMGAFWGVYGADKGGSWVVGLLARDARRRLAGARPRVLLDPPARGPDRRGHRGELPRPRHHRLLLLRALQRRGRAGRRSPRSRTSRSRTSRTGGSSGRRSATSNLMVWMSFALVIVSYFVLFRTPIGLRIRACGEHPRAADTVGIDVYSVRYGAVVFSGVLAGARRRLPLDRLQRRRVQREHDRRPRLHRARRADLRRLAAVRHLLRGAPVRVLDRARVPPATSTPTRRRRSSRRCPTSSRSSPSPGSSAARFRRPPSANRMSDNRRAGRPAAAALVLGLLALAAIPVAAVVAAVREDIGLLEAEIVAVPVALRARPHRRVALAPRTVPRRAQRAPRRRRPRARRAARGLVRRLRRGHGRARARLLRRFARCVLRVTLHALVRDRQQPSRGARAPGDRVRPGRAGDEDPQQVPPLARGGALRAAARPRRTSRASCARTRTTSASTASSTSTSSTRASSPTSGSSGRGGPRRAPQRRNRRFETGLVLVVLAGDHGRDGDRDHAPGSRRAATTPRRPTKKAGARTQVVKPPRPYLVVKGVGGSSYVAIRRGGPSGAVVFEGTVGQGRHRAVPRQALLAQREHARAPRDHGRRQARDARRQAAARAHGHARRAGRRR